MNRFVAFLAAWGRPGPDRIALLADYVAQDPLAARLLTNPPPRPLIAIGTLRDWISAETGLPDWLIDASRRATGDLTEAFALLLPAPSPPEPDLAEILAELAALPPGPLAKSAILATARRLPPAQRALYFRLVTGTFRSPITAEQMADALRPAAGAVRHIENPAHTILGVMIYAEAALAAGATGPEITLAIWDGPALIPVARVRANLPAPQTATLMAWIRSHATGRFGPLRAIPARQVFRVGFAGLVRNHRRKSGVTLTNPHVLAWLPDCDPQEATHLAALTNLLPNKA